MEQFVALGLMGVRVIPLPDLGCESVYFGPYRLLVVDADLTPAQCEAIACEALGAVAASLSELN